MGSGKRDFSEFNAKLEKHIERLPDYAQRAQEKLQRYFPPEGQEGGRSASRSSGTDQPRPPRQARSRPAMPPMPSMPSMSSMRVNLPPAVEEARSKWAQWKDPAAKLARQKRRASRALTLWIVLTILAALWAFGAAAGMLGNAGGLEAAFGGIAVAVVSGALIVRSGIRIAQLRKVRIPEITQKGPPPLPPQSSAARAPMERLAESEASLAELLRQLETPAAAETTSVPLVSVEDARATAKEAANALRGLAGRLQAVERARDASPPGEHGALDSAIGTLTEQLTDGLDGYGSLVAAAGKAVAASAGGMQASKEALTDATDHLAGLAIALRELS
ncbi:phage shock envelope stress response protein PspM [Amycolatopsis sp. CA-230715]|uniref:phage shock envelope stress response protein PspM n=1 Tax=Amycolatopsis sp. CA-230715 TaxID=2745196 RepID=UPI001C016737|nr:hypothetical protein [Amycolatopsis sp. CA-230715]QWF77044.1 hypothetical protein HUW46_00424 [Amycolatopsis sp. CA-230715]